MQYLCIAFCLFAYSCREVQPLDPVLEETDGFSVEGTVTSDGGVPVDSVQIRLWYNFDIADIPAIDTTHVVVTDPTKIVDVSVLTPDGDFVRQLHLSYLPPGPVPRFQWNYFDSDGNYAPSGEYIVRYAFDTVVVKIEHRVIQGTPSAMTDANGRFSLTKNRLPIGRTFDLYNVQNQYAGTYVVLPKIDLELRRGALFGASSVTLQLNRITTATLIVR